MLTSCSVPVICCVAGPLFAEGMLTFVAIAAAFAAVAAECHANRHDRDDDDNADDRQDFLFHREPPILFFQGI